ncbi:craniofacial development protein 2 [Plakobranchus ocellatus]|uniref:Craniofacial development protein 2 n=1 Tax=Plakobranchus ocellatus TaxID=259542 RepID=A0AAV4DT15_9GAST|nr:craniofacial development protein 2 [Plakobranchus ocellatus]
MEDLWRSIAFMKATKSTLAAKRTYMNRNLLEFLVHKDLLKNLMGCQLFLRRLIPIRLRANPFNITIIQVYALTTEHDDEEIEFFYDQLEEIIDKILRKNILVF